MLGIYSDVSELADSEEREELHRHAVQSEQVSRITAMLALARSEPGIAIGPDELDRDSWLLNCHNGTISTPKEPSV